MYKDIAKEVQTKGYKIFHEVEHTEQSYIHFMKQFGELERHELFMNSKEVPELFYVTDKRGSPVEVNQPIEEDFDWF